jgi:hypothetical protein
MVKICKKIKLILNSILILTLSLLSLAAIGAVESVELDFVPLDNSVDCHRILFRSSQHFTGTIFAVPRVVPGNGFYAATGVESTRIFNIMRSKKPGFYDLAVFLYFPANEEAIKSTKASLFKKDIGACNWDEALMAVNRQIPDTEHKINTISNIPLTSIEMRIPGFEKSGRVGTFDTGEEPTILEYYGKSISVHFEISETELKMFESQVVASTGLNATILLRFQARSRAGSVNAKVDTEGLVNAFSAEAAAKGLKYVGEADLAVLLKSSLQRTAITIQGDEGSSSENVSKVTQQILDKVFKEVSFLSPNPESKKSKTAGKSESAAISISAVVDILRSRISANISYEMFSASEGAMAQMELNLQTDRLNDPDIAEVTVKAQYLDPSSGMYLNAGETITIVPSYWYTDKIEYLVRRIPLSDYDLRNNNLQDYFSDITNEHMRISDGTINGNLVALGHWHPLVSNDTIKLPYTFRWERVVREANRKRLESGEIPTRIEVLKDLPVFLSFSKLLDRKQTRLSELMDEKEFWSAVYDHSTGRIILTANVDLGIVRFRERINGKDNIDYDTKPIVLDEVFETIRGPFGAPEVRDHQVLKSDAKSIIKQKAIVFNVSRPKILRGRELEYVKTLSKRLHPSPHL